MVIKTSNPVIYTKKPFDAHAYEYKYSNGDGDDKEGGIFSKFKEKRKRKKEGKANKADYDKELAEINKANVGTNERVADAKKGAADVNLAHLKTVAATTKLKADTSKGQVAIDIVDKKEKNHKIAIWVGVAVVVIGVGFFILKRKKK